MGSGHPGAWELMEPSPGTRAQSPELPACQGQQQVLSWIKRPLVLASRPDRAALLSPRHYQPVDLVSSLKEPNSSVVFI